MEKFPGHGLWWPDGPGRPPGPPTSDSDPVPQFYTLHLLIVKRIKCAFYNKEMRKVRVDGSFLIWKSIISRFSNKK